MGFKYQLPSGADPLTGGLLQQFSDAEGRVTAFAYDAARNLTTITWPDLRTRTFHYENSSFPRALTGITDELGNRFATFGYDAEGRAVSTERAGGAGAYSVTYASPPRVVVTESLDTATGVLYRYHDWAPLQAASVTGPNGIARVLEASSVNGKNLLSTSSQPAGSGCSASTASMTYDANGNIASKVDFDGSKSCFVHDTARNLRTVAVEGLSGSAQCASVTPASAALPAGARKITTSWHPDWALPVRTWQPGSRVTNVFNGQPDPSASNATLTCAPTSALLPDGKPIAVLCKRIEEATTDVNGSLGAGASLAPGVAARVSQWTYTADGQVLTATDPRNTTTSGAYYGASDFGPSYDMQYAGVSLLLQANGTAGSTTFTDASPIPTSFTAVGNAQVSSTSNLSGVGSLALDGNGDYLTASPVPSVAFGTADFTIEFFAMKPANGTGGYDSVLSTYSDYYGTNGWAVELSATRGFLFLAPPSPSAYLSIVAQANLNPNDSAWHHWAVTRAGSTLRLFKDGVVLTTATVTASIPATNFMVGAGNGNYPFNGNLQQVRITNGVARYVANFTVPTQAFPATGPAAGAVGHMKGDLQTLTDTSGGITQFTQYDPAGRVRQTVDPKGITTDVTYTPRGMVSTVTVTAPGMASRTTTYGYDHAGQLASIAQPDGTTVTFSYDAAQRLTGYTDARGNAVSYTLDAAGNRIGEDIRDPGGTLRRSASRSFDALNRLQQVTGGTQ
jgi:YD repeat-containing protein